MLGHQLLTLLAVFAALAVSLVNTASNVQQPPVAHGAITTTTTARAVATQVAVPPTTQSLIHDQLRKVGNFSHHDPYATQLAWTAARDFKLNAAFRYLLPQPARFNSAFVLSGQFRAIVQNVFTICGVNTTVACVAPATVMRNALDDYRPTDIEATQVAMQKSPLAKLDFHPILNLATLPTAH
ncbi:hypothetical protein RI367_007131 [Sorochytrium milnesiophthora]